MDVLSETAEDQQDELHLGGLVEETRHQIETMANTLKETDHIWHILIRIRCEKYY